MKAIIWHRGLNTIAIAIVSTITNAIVLLLNTSVVAQVIPDRTLGPEQSILNRNVRINGQNSDRIVGGARRGANLFHSFEQFNVTNGQRLYFANPAGIDHIITRVTGSDRSNISGTLGVQGNANLFLLNPNGVIFGRNARLDINGSFIATTASRLRFADGTEFRATTTSSTPLLTVSVPLGLQFGANSGSIRVRGDGQGLRSGTGGGSGGGGGGSGGGGSGSGSGGGSDGGSDGDGVGTNHALRVPADQTLALVGGSIISSGGTLRTDGGRIALGSVAGRGFVTLTPRPRGWVLNYDDQTNFGDVRLLRATAVDASGSAGGDIQIQARQVILQGGSAIEATTLGDASGGTVSITASERVELSGTTADNPQDRRRFVTSISADNRGAGNIPGELTVNTAQLTIRHGARISASNRRSGVGGNITITATDRIELVGTGISPGGLRSSGISVQTRGTGTAGDVRITTRQLVMREGAEVSASTFGSGTGGDVNIQATEQVSLTGTSEDGSLRSRIVAEVGFRREVTISDDPESNQPTGTPQGGDVNVITDQLRIQDGAGVSVSSRRPNGRAGNLNITANTIALDQGGITAETRAGNDAVITLQNVDNLSLQNNSLISAQAFASATGGNVTIDATNGFVVATPGQNSDIIASANQGEGGDISITAQGILGIEERFSLPPNQTNDIDASSQFNQAGTVTINRPEVDPTQGLVALSSTLIDRATQIDRACSPKNGQLSRFVVTGRGGLPLSPDQLLRDRTIVSPGWVTLDAPSEQLSTEALPQQDERHSEQTHSTETSLVEADGFNRGANGEIELVARSPVNQTIAQSIGDCQER